MPLGPAQDAIRDSARLEALRGLGLLDGPPQAGFDRLTRLVRQALRVPVALVSLVEAERQFFLSADGLPEKLATARETPLSHSFCQHVVRTGAPFRVEDAMDHELVRENLAVAEFGVVAYLGQPLLTPEGHVLGALCAIDTRSRDWSAEEEGALADLAALANQELALRHFATELDAQVREGTATRLALQEQLAQSRRLEALGQLAGGVAHDFANVLQAVQGGVRLATKNLDRDDPAAARRVLEAVADAAQRGGSITRRLLGFARRGELLVDRIDPAAVLADLHDVLARTLSWPALRIRVDASAGLPIVLVDRGELETVLVNLATNARDAMPNGGTLTLSARAEAVAGAGRHPAGLSAGRYVRLAAEDTGVGMDGATLARAAEPFFSTKPEGEGTGLGLPMARDFAAQAGGGFAIASEPGRGTTVTLWLPAAGGAGTRKPATTKLDAQAASEAR